VCDICYASITFNNENFNDDYMDNKTIFKCAFCKFQNVFSTTINNYNTNDKLIKLLIQINNNKFIVINTLVRDINNLRKCNKSLICENNVLNKKLNNVKLEIEYKPDNKLKQIEDVIKNTKRRTLLYDEINNIIKN
jgi:predicted metal-binding protein